MPKPERVVKPGAKTSHKIPIHLSTPDKLLLGLTARQTLILACGLTLAYSLVQQEWHSAFLFGLALVVAGVLVLLACLMAFYAPKKRFLEIWFLVVAQYCVLPKYYVWRPLRDARNPHAKEGHPTEPEQREEEKGLL